MKAITIIAPAIRTALHGIGDKCRMHKRQLVKGDAQEMDGEVSGDCNLCYLEIEEVLFCD